MNNGNSRQRVTGAAVFKTLKNNKEALVVAEKLVQSEKMQSRRKSRYNNIITKMSDFRKVQSKILEKSENTEHILTMFPEVELIADIITTMTVSPDENVNSINFTYTSSLDLTNYFKNQLLDFTKEYITKHYKLEEKISDIFREACVLKGAYIEFIVPEAAVSDVINNKLEIFTEDSESKSTRFGKTNFLGNVSRSDIQSDLSNELVFKLYDTRRSNLQNYYKEYQIEAPKFKTSSELIRFMQENALNRFSVTEDFRGIISTETSVKKTKNDFKSSVFKHVSPLKETNDFYTYESSVDTSVVGANQVHVDSPTGITSKTRELNERLNEKINATFMNQIDIPDEEVFKQIRKNHEQHDKIYMLQTKDTTSRPSIGQPMIMKLPPDAVIPIIYQNNPEKHLGYFILTDGFGTPLDYNTILNSRHLFNTERFDHTYSDWNHEIAARARIALFGTMDIDISVPEMEEMYGALLDNMIKRKLKNGKVGEFISMKENYDLYKVMFNRAIFEQETKLVYVPEELIIYYAYEYRKNGTGKALVEKSTLIYSMRMILNFVSVMAKIRTAIPSTAINIRLDEFDQDPESYIEEVKSKIFKHREVRNVIGDVNIFNLSDWINRSGYKFNITGSKYIPEVEIEESDMPSAWVPVEEELHERLKEESLLGYGLTKDLVDTGTQVDFATVKLTSNKLFLNRTLKRQRTTNKFLTEHIKKILMNDSQYVESILELIEKEEEKKPVKNLDTILKCIRSIVSEDNPLKEVREEKDKVVYQIDGGKNAAINYFISSFIDHIEVKLPEPNRGSDSELLSTLSDELSNIDTISESIFNDEIFPSDMIGEVPSRQLQRAKAFFKFKRTTQFLKDHNLYPELTSLFALDDLGKYQNDMLKDYASTLQIVIGALNEASPGIEVTTLKAQAENAKVEQELELINEKLQNEAEQSKTNLQNIYGGEGKPIEVSSPTPATGDTGDTGDDQGKEGNEGDQEDEKQTMDNDDEMKF